MRATTKFLSTSFLLVILGLAFLIPEASAATVPDVVGKTQSQATTLIIAAGLTVTVTQQASTTVAAGNVISQSQRPAPRPTAGSAVNLVVSPGRDCRTEWSA
ncbi:MAG: PASTA domain-containing protein [Candidatus Competibacteraceae bacterium]